MRNWKSIDEVHQHALKTENKQIKSLIKKETLDKYYQNPKNKGWIGNSIEEDWFGVKNNSRNEPDIPHLNLEIKVTPISKTRNGWSAKERLSLNIFNFNKEHKYTFLNSSLYKKASSMEVMFYEHLKGVESPELFIRKAKQINLSELPKEDLLIIEEDWNIIVDKIKEGKAEELSDNLTKYLGATTKGGKTEKNLTDQPFSSKKAHRRAFTLKTTYMTQFVKRMMNDEQKSEKIIDDISLLEQNSFEEIVLANFYPYIGKTKESLARLFNVRIPKNNDKASSAQLAKKMLNLENDIQETEEFKKAGISVKIITVEKGKDKTTEEFKITMPDNTVISPVELVREKWGDSILRDYLSSMQFLFVVFEKDKDSTIFKGAKFWRVPYTDLENGIKETWEDVQLIFNNGIELTYKKYKKPLKSTGKTYYIENNFPKSSETPILHIRPSAKYACYQENESFATKLPVKSKWVNRPDNLKDELTDFYITKQAWWLNSDYVYKQVQDLL